MRDRKSFLKIGFAVGVGISLVTTRLIAQCSDAGVCTLNKHVTMDQESRHHHHIGVGYVFGRSSSSDDITYHTVRLEGTFQILELSRFSFLLPFNSQSGPLGSVSGVGDAIVVWNQTLVQQRDVQLHAQLGGKFATGNANGEAMLPQWYQSGLGSNDILLGLTIELGAFDAAIAGQFPFGRSPNPITRLKRGNDLLARAGYTFQSGKLTLHPSLLMIKRLGESSVGNPASPPIPEFIDVPESNQLQINLQADASFRISEMYSIEGGIAVPFLKRKVNVDGLTRALTITTGLSFWF